MPWRTAKVIEDGTYTDGPWEPADQKWSAGVQNWIFKFHPKEIAIEVSAIFMAQEGKGIRLQFNRPENNILTVELHSQNRGEGTMGVESYLIHWLVKLPFSKYPPIEYAIAQPDNPKWAEDDFYRKFVLIRNGQRDEHPTDPLCMFLNDRFAGRTKGHCISEGGWDHLVWFDYNLGMTSNTHDIRAPIRIRRGKDGGMELDIRAFAKVTTKKCRFEQMGTSSFYQLHRMSVIIHQFILDHREELERAFPDG